MRMKDKIMCGRGTKGQKDVGKMQGRRIEVWKDEQMMNIWIYKGRIAGRMDERQEDVREKDNNGLLK